MADAADQVTDDDERAMALLEEQLRQRRIAESMKPSVFDPDKRCCDCGERIGIERLRLLNGTGRCAPCAHRAELHCAGMPWK